MADENPAGIIADARRYMFTLASILCGTLLALDAERDCDPLYQEIAHRWILDTESNVGEMVFHDIIHPQALDSARSTAEHHAEWDCRIVWGINLPAQRASGHRSLQSQNSRL